MMAEAKFEPTGVPPMMGAPSEPTTPAHDDPIYAVINSSDVRSGGIRWHRPKNRCVVVLTNSDAPYTTGPGWSRRVCRPIQLCTRTLVRCVREDSFKFLARTSTEQWPHM